MIVVNSSVWIDWFNGTETRGIVPLDDVLGMEPVYRHFGDHLRFRPPDLDLRLPVTVRAMNDDASRSQSAEQDLPTADWVFSDDRSYTSHCCFHQRPYLKNTLFSTLRDSRELRKLTPQASPLADT